MSTRLNFYLNNTLVNPPKNWQEMSLELNFDKDGNVKESVTLNTFDFVRENSDTINAALTNGRLFEGMPLRIEVERNGVVEVPYNGYLDLTQRNNYSRDISTVAAKELQGIDWLNDVADSFTFEYLKAKGTITNDDYAFMPYVINSVPDYKESAIALIGSYVVISQISDAIEKVNEILPDIANPTTAISAIVKASLLVIYLVGLLVALIKFVKDLVTQLIQPIKYHACMSIKLQMQKACQHLGLNYSSSIFSGTFENAYLMPEKYYNPVNSTNGTILGYTIPKKTEQIGEFKGTFGDLLRGLKKAFNAKVVIQNGTLYFERLDYNITPPTYVLPDVYQPFFTTNADEFKANYYVHFDYDTIEKNTIQEWNGTSYQVILNQAVTANDGYQLMKGLEDVFIPYSLAKRKTDLTVPEKIIKLFLNALDLIINALIAIVNVLIQAINAIIGVLNSVINVLDFIGINVNLSIPIIPTITYVNLSNLIDNRIGMMKIETDFTSKPKIFLMDLGVSNRFNKLSVNNETLLSAEYLYNNFHYINSFVPTTDKPFGNQYLVYNTDNVPFGFQHYLQVKSNNQIQAYGNDALIESVSWNIFNQKSTLKFRVNTLLSSNFSQTILIPNGQ